MPTTRTLIGCEEWCTLDSLGIPAIKVRVDSGAKTSAIHAFHIQPFRKHDSTWVKFSVHPLQNNRRVTIDCEAPVVDQRIVKSSSGNTEKRYVVRADIALGEKTFSIELTLSNRDSMGYRMLLGREAMAGRMLVDPDRHFQQGKFNSNELTALYGEHQADLTGLKIALLGDNPDSRNIAILGREAENRGHSALFIDLRECYVKLDPRDSDILYLKDQPLEEFDAVMPLLDGSNRFYGTALLRHFENLGIYVINSAEAINRTHTPLLALQMLETHEIPIPTTVFSSGPHHTRELIQLAGGAPLSITFCDRFETGRIATTEQQAKELIDSETARTENLLIQQHTGNPGKKIRALVINGKAPFAVAVVDQDPATTSERYFSPIRLTAGEQRLAVRACKAMRLRIAEVEMILEGADYQVLSVSSAPGLERFRVNKSRNGALSVIKAVERGLGWKRR